ncbi:MAG: hypothetical protein V7742_14215 [Halioglobus sp.]
MPRLLVGYTEPGGSKLKKDNRFLKPNFGVGLNPETILTASPQRQNNLTLYVRIVTLLQIV